MFKGLVIQNLYGLSDDQLEYQIEDRCSFQRFLGLNNHQRSPDAKTYWMQTTVARMRGPIVLIVHKRKKKIFLSLAIAAEYIVRVSEESH